MKNIAISFGTAVRAFAEIGTTKVVIAKKENGYEIKGAPSSYEYIVKDFIQNGHSLEDAAVYMVECIKTFEPARGHFCTPGNSHFYMSDGVRIGYDGE